MTIKNEWQETLEEARKEINRYKLLLEGDVSPQEQLNIEFYLRFAQMEHKALIQEAQENLNEKIQKGR